MTGTFSNVSPVNANHGFHAHEDGVIQPTCAEANGHFNPNGRMHGAPTNP